MATMKAILTSLPWWELSPDPVPGHWEDAVLLLESE
jgi:hypothetical protein